MGKNKNNNTNQAATTPDETKVNETSEVETSENKVDTSTETTETTDVNKEDEKEIDVIDVSRPDTDEEKEKDVQEPSKNATIDETKVNETSVDKEEPKKQEETVKDETTPTEKELDDAPISEDFIVASKIPVFESSAKSTEELLKKKNIKYTKKEINKIHYFVYGGTNNKVDALAFRRKIQKFTGLTVHIISK